MAVVILQHFITEIIIAAVTGAATVILAMGAGKLGVKSIDEQLFAK